MYTAYSVASMALYLVFFSCLVNSLYSKEHMKIIETRPREIGFVLWDHCQNLLDDPRIYDLT